MTRMPRPRRRRVRSTVAILVAGFGAALALPSLPSLPGAEPSAGAADGAAPARRPRR